MKCPVYYDSTDQNYYVPLFTDGGHTFFIEKTFKDYEDEDILWVPGNMNTYTYNRLVEVRFLHITDLEVEDNYIANYMLLV